MTTFGEVSWSDKSAGYSSENKGGADQWLRLEDGPNTIRLVTAPYQYVVHSGVKREGDRGYGQKVTCSKPQGSCTLCDQGFETGLRWLVGVIDRKSNSYRVLDIGPLVFFGIKALNEGKWGNPLHYDMDIIKNSRSKDPKGFYLVQPVERSPLSASDQKILDEQMDLEFLQKRVSPLSPEQVQKRIERILEGGGELAAPVKKEKFGKKDAAKTSSVAVKATTKLAEDEAELDSLFPSYEETSNS